jgi:hypothetical protein
MPLCTPGAAAASEGSGVAPAGLAVASHASRLVVDLTGPWVSPWHHAAAVVVVTFGLSATPPSGEILGLSSSYGFVW